MLIQEMRNRSEGLLAKIIVAMIIVVFALFGFGSITTFLTPVPKVAEVGDEEITRQAFDAAVERNKRLLLAQNPSMTEVDEMQLQDDVLRGLINRALMEQAASDLGLYYGDSQVDAEILATPVFQIEGIFNADQFRAVLGSLGYSPSIYRQEIARDKRIQQLSSALRTSAFMTSNEAVSVSRIAQQKRDLAWVILSVDKLMDKPAVAESDVEAYYSINADQYMTEELVNLEYVEVNRDALVEGIDVDADAVASHFEANKENYTQPERKRFAHILIEVNDDRPGEAALQIISDIAAEISAGKDFAALARERSEDSGSGANGGDLDYQEAGTFVPEFETAGHALTVGEVSSPVKTEFGYHLIKLLDVEEARVPVLADIQEQIAKDLLQSRAEEQFIDLSSRLGELAYEANDLQEPAETLGLVVKTTGLITRHETQGIGVSPKVMEAAYSAEVFDDGNNSDTIAIDENHHVVIRVTDHRPSELKPITDVREDIVDAIARERAELAARDQALKITGMLEEGSLTRYIENEFEVDFQNLPDATRNQLGMDRAINEEGFRLPRPAPDGKSIGQGVLSNGDAFVITVTRVNDVQGDELLKEDVSNIGRVLATRSGQNNYASFRAYYKAENEVWIKPEFGN